MFKSQAKQQKASKPKKEASSYYYDDDSLNLDIATVNKFARLKVTVPLSTTKLEETIKELEELKVAFDEKGEEERSEAKARFLRS